MTMQILEWLKGKKTYIMIGVDALDQIGVVQGWWDENRAREIAEFVFTAAFLRAGVEKSGPIAPKV